MVPGNLHCFSVHSFSLGLSQDTLDASLQSFQQDRLSEITDLKDQLVAAQHRQTKAIEERHDALLRLWEQLLEASAAHREKLLEKQLPLQQVKEKTHDQASIICILVMEPRNGFHWNSCLDKL